MKFTQCIRNPACFRSAWMGLIIISIGTLMRGIFYLPALTGDNQPPALSAFLPQWAWIGLWVGAGLHGLICSVMRGHLAVAVGACTALHFLWGFFYLVSFAMGESPRGYVTSLSYWLIVLLCMWAFGRGQKDQVKI